MTFRGPFIGLKLVVLEELLGFEEPAQQFFNGAAVPHFRTPIQPVGEAVGVV